jgi:5-formyltetrahydrofolate cyclo-ligase
MPESVSDKTALRRSLIAARNMLPAERRAEADAAISMRIQAWLKANPVDTLGVYWPMRGEPDLRDLYAMLDQQGMKLALPVAVQLAAPLAFALWKPGETLDKDACGVPAPAARTLVRPDALLIPCVGFTKSNIRLGYGGGFYDRTLALAPRPRTAGIAYACALSEFERNVHDVALDTVITESAPLP